MAGGVSVDDFSPIFRYRFVGTGAASVNGVAFLR